MGLGFLMGVGGIALLGAGLIALVALSTGLVIFGKSLEILTQQADGMGYFADSLNMLVESMQNLTKFDGTGIVMGLGFLMGVGDIALLGAGLIALVALSTGLVVFGKSLEVITAQADGM